MKIIIKIILFISIVFGLTDEQLGKIKDKTDDSLLAPNFTLKSLESRSFSKIKYHIRNLLDESLKWQRTYGEFPINVQDMINKGAISLDDEFIKWKFELDINKINDKIEGKITADKLGSAINTINEEIKVVYNIENDAFSFFTSNEDNMTFDSTITLDSLRGKVVLINFWATWCGPCRMEIPDFNELYNRYNEKGFEVLAISISDPRGPLLEFKNAYNMFYPVLYGNQREMSKIQMEYGGIYSIPMSFLIDKKGEVIRVYPGAIIKQFDPSMYTDLVMNIENALLK